MRKTVITITDLINEKLIQTPWKRPLYFAKESKKSNCLKNKDKLGNHLQSLRECGKQFQAFSDEAMLSGFFHSLGSTATNWRLPKNKPALQTKFVDFSMPQTPQKQLLRALTHHENKFISFNKDMSSISILIGSKEILFLDRLKPKWFFPSRILDDPGQNIDKWSGITTYCFNKSYCKPQFCTEHHYICWHGQDLMSLHTNEKKRSLCWMDWKLKWLFASRILHDPS